MFPQEFGEPEWLLSWRKKAHEEALVLPVGERYGIAIPALEPKDVVSFDQKVEYHVTPSKGLELYTWKEALAQEELAPIIQGLFESPLLPPATSRVAAFGRAHFSNGIVVYVQPTLDESGVPTMETLTLKTTVPQGSAADVVIVIAKTGARLTMESVVSGGHSDGVFARTTLLLLEEGAHLSVNPSVSSVQGFVSAESVLLVGAHSHVSWTEDPGTSPMYRSFVNGYLVGDAARCELFHVLLGDGEMSWDIGARVRHFAEATYSRVVAAGLFGGHSRTVYRGDITMEPGVQHTDGAQEARFLLVSPTAKVDAIPALDIASKDVRSGHKLSVSHVRPADLFYAKTRGIAHDDARTLSVEGFFSNLFTIFHKNELFDMLRPRIEEMVLRNKGN